MPRPTLLLLSSQPLPPDLARALGECFDLRMHDPCAETASGADADLILVDAAGADNAQRAALRHFRASRPGAPVMALLSSVRAADGAGRAGDHAARTRSENHARAFDGSALAPGRHAHEGESRSTNGHAAPPAPEPALRHDSTLVAQAVENSPVSIVITDVEGTIEYVNPRFEDLAGYSMREVVGKNCRLLQSGLTPRQTYAELWATLARGEAWLGEFVNRKKCGELYWVRASISPVRDGSGETTHYVGLKEDITERKRLEHALNASEARYQAMFETTAAVMLVIDPVTGALLDANPAAAAYYGYSREQLRAMRITDLAMLPEAEHAELRRKALAGELSYLRLQHRRADGSVRDIESMNTPAVWGATTVLYAVVHDVTERVRAEQALLTERTLLRTLIDSVPDFVYVKDVERRIVLSNVAHARALGATPADVVGRTDHALFPDQLADTYRDNDLEVLRTGSAQLNQQETHITPDGETRWLLTSRVPWRGPDGAARGIVGISRDVTDLRRIEDALKASEARFRGLVDALHDVVYTFGPDQRHTGVYGRWLNYAGYMPAGLVGKTAREILGPQGGALHEAANALALNGQSVVFEWEAQGHVFQTALSPRCDETGQVVEVVGLGRDITALKQTETALRDSERFSRSIVDALHSAIAILDEDGTILTVNQAWREFAAANGADVSAVCEGANYFRALDVPGDSDDARIAREVNVGLREVMSGALDEFTLEYPCHSPHEQRWFLVRATRFKGDGPLRLVIAHENITLRKQAERQVQAANERLAEQNEALEAQVAQRTAQLQTANHDLTTILETVGDGILLMDRDDVIVRTNAAFRLLLRAEGEDAIGRPLSALIDSEDRPALARAQETVRASMAPARIDVRVHRDDDTTFIGDMTLDLVKDNDGHIVASLRDVTHVKELERAKDQFVSMVSHELRTPAASILLSASNLRTYFDRMTDEQRTATIHRAEESARSLVELIEGILDLSRIDVGSAPLGSSRCDLACIAAKTAGELRMTAEARRQELRTAVDERAAAIVVGSEVPFARVWRNLLGNAVKYTQDGGAITARVGVCAVGPTGGVACSPSLIPGRWRAALPPGRYVVGQVEDNGPGIPDADMAQLFGRFCRGWAASSGIPGTGLGLALARELLRQYGGDIAVSSYVGAGSIFTFWLPAAPDEASA